MNNDKVVFYNRRCGMQPATHLNAQPEPTAARVLKLALDVHLQEHVVAMQYDGSSPKPPQRFKPKEFPGLGGKTNRPGLEDHFLLRSRAVRLRPAPAITALGVTNHVIRPRNWDDEHKRVKTDRTDALGHAHRPGPFVAGNKHALALVRVPTEAEGTRPHRKPFAPESAQGFETRRPSADADWPFNTAIVLKGCWYGPRAWPQLEIPGWLATLLTSVANRPPWP